MNKKNFYSNHLRKVGLTEKTLRGIIASNIPNDIEDVIVSYLKFNL